MRDTHVSRVYNTDQCSLHTQDREWEKVKLSKGFAVYDVLDDQTVTDVTRRADKLMYEDKRNRKAGRDA